MPANAEPLTRLLDCGLVAVVRASDGSLLADVAEALAAGGVLGIEITFTVPAAHRVLEQVAARLGDRIVLGAGTVLDAETARIALLSGAKFIVSPCVRPDLIALCKRYSAPVMPGAMTPTEVLAAWEAGADVVKVFPAEIGGPAYLKALHGPLPHVRLMPTGGVNLQTAAAFLQAGACALGVGSALVDPQAIAARKFEQLTSLAQQYVQLVRETRAALGR